MGTEEGTWEVTGFEKDKAFAITYESERFVGDGSWDLESAGDGTRLTYRFVGNGKGILSKLLMPIMMPMVRGQETTNYPKLKEVLESGS